ncbi:outer membrane protein [Bradyrhizobium sp. CCBAU 51627]|uniref:outer membrane protein n=1 Tax=Bradyrhizobium sp. CCBAU 51627 TaxID=1325088 RepID=UPI0023063870|nr:outer membrane beta-barrel protein [Bradyrhizobium sp. CCBAU 51627]MDA9432187.1 membrane protein [Bradyrhizobium sp. CCBAU 51627]
MKKLLAAHLAAFAVTLAGPAAAADLAVKAPVPVAPFNWTGCYIGVHVGAGFAKKDITDPVQLVQDSFLGPGSTVGATTVSASPSGAVIGGQGGCDYQFASSSIVVGIQGDVAGLTLRNNKTVALPLGNPGETAIVDAKTEFLTSVTGRIGYAFDDVMLYAKAGAAMAGDKYEVSGTFTGLPFDFRGLEDRWGWTAGAGVDWAFTRHWSANLEYDYYGFGTRTSTFADQDNAFLGLVNVRQSIQVVKVGVNFHMWAGQ